MERAKNNISKAFRISADTILVYLCRDWQENRFPPIFIMPERRRMKRLQRASFWRFGEISGYFVKDGWISFMVLSDDYPEIIREDADKVSNEYFLIGNMASILLCLGYWWAKLQLIG